MHTDGTITISVNGEHKRVTAGLTIAQLASELGLVPEKVAVERNLEVVPRSTLAQVCVEDGDELEIVHFVGGGDHARPIAEDMWSVACRLATGAAGRSAGGQGRRLSCCFIYALPGMRECAACPRGARGADGRRPGT